MNLDAREAVKMCLYGTIGGLMVGSHCFEKRRTCPKATKNGS